MCRANGGIYRLSCETPWRYDGKALCMSKQTVTCLVMHDALPAYRHGAPQLNRYIGNDNRKVVRSTIVLDGQIARVHKGFIL